MSDCHRYRRQIHRKSTEAVLFQLILSVQSRLSDLLVLLALLIRCHPSVRSSRSHPSDLSVRSPRSRPSDLSPRFRLSLRNPLDLLVRGLSRQRRLNPSVLLVQSSR